MAHGKDAVKTVEGSTEAFFGVDLSEIAKLPKDKFESIFYHTDKIKIPKSELKDLSTLVVKTSLR